MLSFLFWNVYGKPLSSQIANIIGSYDIDIAFLAENRIEPASLVSEIDSKRVGKYFFLKSIGCERIHIFSRFTEEFFTQVYGDSYTSIRNLKLVGLDDIFIAVTHLSSKMYKSSYENQILGCQNLSFEIQDIEERAGHNRTILIGDFNMNPFEHGIIGAIGFHGMMSKKDSLRKPIKIEGRVFPYFYNPMWNFFGDEHCSAPGTYYLKENKDVCYYWNIYDQVLIRPELLDYFDIKSLKILTDDGVGTKLVTNDGSPDKKNFSDHLPIVFTLNI